MISADHPVRNKFTTHSQALKSLLTQLSEAHNLDCDTKTHTAKGSSHPT